MAADTRTEANWFSTGDELVDNEMSFFFLSSVGNGIYTAMIGVQAKAILFVASFELIFISHNK